MDWSNIWYSNCNSHERKEKPAQEGTSYIVTKEKLEFSASAIYENLRSMYVSSELMIKVHETRTGRGNEKNGSSKEVDREW